MVFALGLGLGAASLAGRAQTDPGAPANPQLQLMLSQPPVDITSPVTATTEFDPPVVRVGEKAVYRVTFNALEASLRWPPSIPSPRGLTLTPSAQGQTLQVVGNSLRPLTSVNFLASSARPGLFAMPAFWVEVYGKPVRVPEAYFEVVEEVDATHEPARRLYVEPARTNLFVGEMIKVRVFAPGSKSNLVESLATPQFSGNGFFVDKNSFRQTIERHEINGRSVPVFVLEANVTAIAAGEQKLTVQAFTSGSRFSGGVVINSPATILGGPAQPVLLDSDPVSFELRPLPSPAMPGFAGFVGNLVADPPQLSTNRVRVGDPVKLLVTFRSDGNLARFVPPPPPRDAGWQLFPPMPADPLPTLPPPVPPLIHAATFAYTMIPLTEEPRATPAIPYSRFDPPTAAYVDVTIPGVPLTIVAEGLPTESSASLWAEANETVPVKKTALSAPATSPGKSVGSLVPLQMQKWFLVVQLFPALALATLWQWDRHRRFLAAHPDIVRRRQALRALSREKRVLARAATYHDAPGFIRSGVTALQIVAAPHYPAEPRALVCGEVLSLFDEGERAGRTGDVIRDFFARQATVSFSPSHGEPEARISANSGLSFSSPEGGEGRGEAAQLFADQIPSPRLGGEREPEAAAACTIFDLRPELERILQQLEARL